MYKKGENEKIIKKGHNLETKYGGGGEGAAIILADYTSSLPLYTFL